MSSTMELEEIDKYYNELTDVIFKNIRTCIHLGKSPKKLYKQIFNIVDKEINNGEVIKVLYNATYGGFGYSIEFAEFLKDKRDILLEEHFYKNSLEFGTTKIDREDVYPFILEFAKFHNITESEALSRASGKYCKLEIKNVPVHRDYEIIEYDGCENVIIKNNFSY